MGPQGQPLQRSQSWKGFNEDVGSEHSAAEDKR